MDGFGADWDSLAQAIGGGKAEGGASDLGTECAQRSSPVWPSRRRAATVPGASAQLLTLWTCARSNQWP